MIALVLAAGGGDGECVHVGHRHAVQLAGGVLVHRFDIVVHLDDVDLEPVFVGPFLHDPGLLGIGPRHPARVDRPADAELGARRRRLVRGGRARRRHECACQQRQPSCVANADEHDSSPFALQHCRKAGRCPDDIITIAMIGNIDIIAAAQAGSGGSVRRIFQGEHASEALCLAVGPAWSRGEFDDADL